MTNEQNPGLVPPSDPEEEKKILEELLKPPEKTQGGGKGTFSIQELTDCYRITGISYGTGCYDLSKTLLESKTQDDHAEHALKAKLDEFRASSAPLIYAICKTLYQNKDGVQKELVEKARKTLEEILGPGKPWINTLSRAKYNPNGIDEVVHDYKQKSQKTKNVSLVGPDGYISKSKTQATEYVQALLDTTDDMKEVNAVFNWITDKDSFAYRINNKPQKTEERVVALGVDDVDRFGLDADGSGIVNGRPAFGVREQKKSP